MQLNHCTRLSVIFKQEKGRSQFPCLRRIPVCRFHADRCDGGMIELIFAGIGTASSALKTLGALAKSRKGIERSFLLELRQNISLIDEFQKKDLHADRLILQLESEKFFRLYESSYNFSRLQRSRVSADTTAGIAALKRYIGWDTERLVSNVYQKIIHLQKIVRIGYDPKRILIRRRLINLLSLLLLLSRHIGR
jgi:hypothetical protein